ncbi:preprotein translocase subunit SecG [Rhodobacteraceae bacterium RKSG542]|uniref:preprotein translocase subunit SecG n=1 Tax=Pseudovibrio flavus TaxID=2529854 RepID=UPI0012BBAA74|nr:preprotein translocase subunit SecG [Pseudovibrio flavus]MTI16647.1 preprotein translocase subunit SecG [Pseudovibrio flavus]
METVLIVIHLMVVLALVALVLLQRSEGGALGIGGGGGGGFMSSRGTANVLTRGTAILAVAFFATSLGLSLLARYDERPGSLIDAVPTAPQTQGEGTEGAGNGLLDQLQGSTEPSGPQVPTAQ